MTAIFGVPHGSQSTVRPSVRPSTGSHRAVIVKAVQGRDLKNTPAIWKTEQLLRVYMILFNTHTLSVFQYEMGGSQDMGNPSAKL